jgi:hypothetical protein
LQQESEATYEELHQQAEALRADAETAFLNNDLQKAKQKRSEAAEKEEHAFERTPTENKKARGTIALSAVTLYYLGRDRDNTLRCGQDYLRDKSIDKRSKEIIESLLEEAWGWDRN